MQRGEESTVISYTHSYVYIIIENNTEQHEHIVVKEKCTVFLLTMLSLVMRVHNVQYCGDVPDFEVTDS